MRRASDLLGLVGACGLAVSLAATSIKALSERNPVVLFFERIVSGAWLADPTHSNIYIFAITIYAFFIILVLSFVLKLVKL